MVSTWAWDSPTPHQLHHHVTDTEEDCRAEDGQDGQEGRQVCTRHPTMCSLDSTADFGQTQTDVSMDTLSGSFNLKFVHLIMSRMNCIGFNV